MPYNDLARGVGLQFLISFFFLFYPSAAFFRFLSTFALIVYLGRQQLRVTPPYLILLAHSFSFVCLFVGMDLSFSLVCTLIVKIYCSGMREEEGKELSLYCVNTICNDQRHQFFFCVCVIRQTNWRTGDLPPVRFTNPQNCLLLFLVFPP